MSQVDGASADVVALYFTGRSVETYEALPSSYTLVRDTNVILLDKEPETSDLNQQIRNALENDGDTVITDLHIWQIGVHKFAAIISLVAHQPKSPSAYKEILKQHEELVHVTVEVHQCEMQPT